MSAPLPELLDAKALQAELCVTRATAEAIMRRLPVVQPDCVRKVFVKRSDVAAYLEAMTFTKTAYPVVRAGTFKSEREAKARRDLVAGEIARGGNPADLLTAMSTAADTFVSFETWGERFVSSRIDVAENTRKMYRSHPRKIGETFGDRDPHSVTAADVAEWVAEQSEERKPGTVAQYLDCFKVLLDYIGVKPNPARDPRVKLPKRVTEEANPPSDQHFLAIVDKLLPRWRLFFLTIEQGGLRIGEAAALRWADIDVAGQRLRLPRSVEGHAVASCPRMDCLAAASHPLEQMRVPGAYDECAGSDKVRCQKGGSTRGRTKPTPVGPACVLPIPLP